MNVEEFQAHVFKDVRPSSEPFKPTATYDPDGDCIEFLAKPESFYGERLDDLVTVFCSHRDGEIIGSLIKGVKSYLLKHPNLVIVVDDGKIRIAHLLMSNVSAGRPLDSLAVRKYQKLVKVAEESNAVVQMPEFVA